MLHSPRLFFLALLALVHVTPFPEHHVVHERRSLLPSAWTKRNRLPHDHYLPMRIGLKQSELENAEYHLMRVSHPNSPDYGKHWHREKVVDAFRPSEETENLVRQWLVDHGIDSERIGHSPDKAWFTFHARVEEAEALLTTEFHEYEHLDAGSLVPSCEQYHLPKHISPHVDYITPGIHLPAPATLKGGRNGKVKRQVAPRSAPTISQRDQTEAGIYKSDLSICDREVTPACIAALYQIPPAPDSVHPNNSLGIYASDLEFWVQCDLDAFFTNYTNIPNGTHPIAANIDGGQQTVEDLKNAGGEITMDLTLSYPIVYPQTIVDFQVDDFIYQSKLRLPKPVIFGFNTFLDALDGSYCNFTAYNQTGNGPVDPIYPDPMGGWQGELECGTKLPTNVISVSYGTQEADVSLSYQKRQCLEFLKLGLQGVSILFASGDSGAGNFPPEYAIGASGCLGVKGDIFNPTWPVNCPWVTAVGGTHLYDGANVTDPESTMYVPATPDNPVNVSSGGGFSNVYIMPDYQKSAVSDYFQAHDPGYPFYSRVALDTDNITKFLDIDYIAGDSGGIYNRIGRGIPDVAANGLNAPVIAGGVYHQYGGTSQSTPIFAAIINRINEERLNAGKSTLGFLNPALYANPSMLNDITNGSQFGCGHGGGTGFPAVPGWDPVTGLGTPNYPKMLAYFMSLP